MKWNILSARIFFRDNPDAWHRKKNLCASLPIQLKLPIPFCELLHFLIDQEFQFYRRNLIFFLSYDEENNFLCDKFPDKPKRNEVRENLNRRTHPAPAAEPQLKYLKRTDELNLSHSRD